MSTKFDESSYAQSSNTAAWYGTTIWPLHRVIDLRLSENVLYALFCIQWHYHIQYWQYCPCLLRRHNFQQKFFKQICRPRKCLHDLLPPERDSSVSLRLRHPTVYPTPQVRTKRYWSFINYSLSIAYYQWQHFMFAIVSFYFIFYHIYVLYLLCFVM